MNYLFPAILFVSVLVCAMMVGTFWSSLHQGRDFSYSLNTAIVAGAAFAIYAGMDYLLIVPGAHYVMA